MQDHNKLQQLLNKMGRYHPHHSGRLANHLPMVLSAISRLGGTDEKLEAVFNKGIGELDYLTELPHADAVDHIRPYLGDSSKYINYLKYYNQQIDLFGHEAVLKASLPVLLPGVAASAFHAIIRLAYAIEVDNDNEIAIALAYWSAEFQSLNLSATPTSDNLETILLKLAPIGSNHQFSPGIIVDRMAEIAKLLKQQGCIVLPQVVELPAIRTLCLQAFHAQADFTLLHTVTGCHAFSIISPYIKDMDLALREFWKAIVVAYLSTGLDYNVTKAKNILTECDFEPLIATALLSDDAHVIKLMYTAVDEFAKNKDYLYFEVARRAVAKVNG